MSHIRECKLPNIAFYPTQSINTLLSGHLEVSPDERTVCVTNLESGSDLYAVPSMRRIHTFQQGVDMNLNYPIQGSLALNGVFVTGSAAGLVYIYDLTSGCRVASLAHAEGLLMFYLRRNLEMTRKTSYRPNCRSSHSGKEIGIIFPGA